MKQKITDARENQRGEVMLEASFIMVAVLILLLVLLALSFLFYQQAVVNSIASDIASDIASNYKITNKPVGDDTIDEEDLSSAILFRTTFRKNRVSNEHVSRAADFSIEFDNRVGMGNEVVGDGGEIDVSFTAVGRSCIRVTIQQVSDSFLADILTYAGIIEDGTIIEATAYAECVDLTGYTSLVNFTEYAATKLSVFNSFSDLFWSIQDLFANVNDG